MLCDTIGSIDNHQWRTEGFRVVGDHEKPLLLQSLWKPREGLARRFEIQKKSSIEKKTSQEKDTITAGNFSFKGYYFIISLHLNSVFLPVKLALNIRFYK